MGLKRVLGAVDCGWLVAGNMIGAGIFFAPGQVAGHLPGIGWPLVAWSLGGLLALCGAAVYAELGSRLPRAGGDYQYLATAFGPLWGFLTGWAGLLLTFSAAAAAMCVVAVDYLQSAFSMPAGTHSIGAPSIVLALTVANVLGARAAGRTTAWLTVLPVVGVAAIFAAGLLSGNAPMERPPGIGPGIPLTGLAAAMLPVFFTYSGWNVAAYMAAEIREPARDLARGLLGGTLAVTAFYVLTNLVLLLVVPPQELAGSTTAMAQFASRSLGRVAEKGVALVIALAVAGSANVTLMAGARIYYAMAEDGLAPRLLARTNRHGVPAYALWVSGVWTAFLATLRSVELLVNWATLAILLLSSMAVLSLFVLRRRRDDPASFRCPGYPATPVVYLIASAAVIYGCARGAPDQSLYGLLIVAAGVPAYFLARRWFGVRSERDGVGVGR